MDLIFTKALESGDSPTALSVLEDITSDQLSEFTFPDKCTPLHYACRHGRVDVAQQLITHFKYSIESKDGKGRTPLHTAAQYGQVSTLKYLLHNLFINEESILSTKSTTLSRSLSSILELKLSNRHRDESGNTLLHTACVHGQLDIVQLLTSEIGCDPNDTNNVTGDMYCKTLFQQHSNMAEKECREMWKEMCGDVNEEEVWNGMSPTSLAAEGGHLDILKYLIEEKGVKLHFAVGRSIKEWGVSPVLTASCGGHLHVVRYLLEKYGCNISQNDRAVILFYTCLVGHTDIVTYLITEADYDPHCSSTLGFSCLDAACWGGHLDVVKYLVDTHHCDPLCPDENKSTPLHMAASSGRLEVVRFFIENIKWDPNCWHHYETTPLHSASKGGHLDVVKYLVDTHHCDPLCPAHDEDKSTPLHLAVSNGQKKVVSYLAITEDCNLHSASLKGYLEVVRFLIEDLKRDPNFKDQDGRTPLHHASEGGHLDVVKYLVDTHHCDPMCPDRHKNTPLHSAAAENQLEIVQYFANIPDCNLQLKNAKKYSPLDIASQCGHHEVDLFLLRATTTDHVFSDILISPSLSMFVLGNSGSGKSTLVKALSDETSWFGRFIPVKDVTPLTAGIVPATINSQVFGSVNIYDFAGHEEYYVSHEILLQQTSHPLVLLTVDISLPLQTIEKQLLYWLSMLSNFQTSHVVVIGSHADLVRGSNTINQKIASLVSTESSIRYHGLILCDCRYSYSSDMNQIRKKLKYVFRSIQVILAQCESSDSNRLCASLMHILKYNIPEKAIITVSEVMKHIKKSYSEELLDESLLVQTCKLLSSNGHLLFMCHEDNILEKSLLVLNKRVILQKVHACLRPRARDIKTSLPNEFGIIEENKLRETLSESLKNVMEPEQAIKYLIFTQFCTEITSDQLISPPDGEKIVTYYFFPNLALASRPSDLLPPGDLKYTHLYTWCLRCSNARQFFTPRYLHTLFIQLIKCDKSVQNKYEYKIWKKGILIVHNNGTRSIIEVTDQTTQVLLAIQCVEGCESYLVKQRSLFISLIKSMAHKICQRIEMDEFFILPQNVFPPDNPTEVPIVKIAHSMIDGLDTVSYDDRGTLQQAFIRDLLLDHSDSLLAIKGPTLDDIFAHHLSNNVIPLATATRIHSAVETCRELQEWFEDEAGQCRRDVTYSQLYRELIKYSIFTVKNSDVSGVHECVTSTLLMWLII